MQRRRVGLACSLHMRPPDPNGAPGAAKMPKSSVPPQWIVSASAPPGFTLPSNTAGSGSRSIFYLCRIWHTLGASDRFGQVAFVVRC